MTWVWNTLIFQQILRSVVSVLLQNTVWCFNIGWTSYVFLSSILSHVILAQCIVSMMSTFYLPGAKQSLACIIKLEPSSRKSNLSIAARRETVIRNRFAPLISAINNALTSSHPIASDWSLEGREKQNCSFTCQEKKHIYTRNWSWYIWKVRMLKVQQHRSMCSLSHEQRVHINYDG